MDVIKLATHGTYMKKEIMIKWIKPIDYNTVAFNASAVAIGYTISSNNNNREVPRKYYPFRMGFTGEKAGQNNMLKWILSGRIVAWT